MLRKEMKIAIINNELASIEQAIYQQQVSARAVKKIGDQQRLDRIISEMTKLEKMLDELKLMLKEEEAEDKEEEKKT